MARVLLIDDDPSLLAILGLAFGDEGHEVSTASDGRQGLARILADRPDAVVSDVNMPGVDGFTLCRKVREAGHDVPILLLTSRDGEIDEALGLDLGADDYVVKPFSTRVLLARVHALLRRRGVPADAATERRQVGDLLLDLDRLAVAFAERPVEVTVTEFRLLEALTARPGVVLTREQLLERVRGDDSVVAIRIVDTYVRRLRRKLEAVRPEFDGIETVIGAGYRWRSG